MKLTSEPKEQISLERSLPTESVVISDLLNRVKPKPETTLLLLAVLIGMGAGAGVVLFRTLIHFIHGLMFGEVSSFFSPWGHWTLALIPFLGGLLIGLLRWRMQDFGPGLAKLMEVVQGNREVALLNPVSKMVAASISLGSGASLGPEGPSVEIGAYFSLLLGKALQVSQERRRLLLSAGAAAGLAAGFNAPIAGVFFALEVVSRTTFAASAASTVLLSAVVAAWIAQIGLGSQPAFALPAYEVRSLMELPLYVGLGLLASGVSLLYVRSLKFSQRCFQGEVRGFHWLTKIPQPLHPVMGGLCLGLVALWRPQILGVGYETIEAMLQDVQFPLSLVVSLLVLKLLMTALSFGSGFVGGVFAPALFLGASLGAMYGKGLAIALPMLHDYIASPPAYAMVGMAAVLAASVRAPLTAILLLFELTHDYRIVLPLMTAVGLSIWLSDHPQPQVVIDNTPEPQPAEAIAPLEVPDITVAEAMHLEPLQMPAAVPLAAAIQTLIERRDRSTLVVGDDQELLGILTLQDINRLLARAKSEAENAVLLSQPIQQHCTTKVLSAHADELLTVAIARMATRGLQQLPVITREAPQRVIGLLAQEDVVLAQAIAHTRKAFQYHLAHQVESHLPHPAEEHLPHSAADHLPHPAEDHLPHLAADPRTSHLEDQETATIAPL